MRRVPRLAAVVALCACLAACSGIDVNRSFRRMLGMPDPPAEHLAVILAVHDAGNWEFRDDAEQPLRRVREAVRKLPDCGYDDWAEVGRVVLVISEMAQEHPAALVRAESVDALARIAAWPEFAEVKTDASVSEAEMIRALKVLREAYEFEEGDAAATFGVADAVRTAGSFRFYQSAGSDDADRDEVLSRYATGLRTARGVLNSFSRARIQRFAADPEVYHALETGNVSVSKAAVNLTLLERALADSEELNRVNALRHLAELRFEGCQGVLRRSVLEDESLATRREAVGAIAELPEAECVPTLVDALADVMSEVRNAAARALHRKTGQAFGTDRRAWALWWREKGEGNASPASPGEE